MKTTEEMFMTIEKTLDRLIRDITKMIAHDENGSAKLKRNILRRIQNAQQELRYNLKRAKASLLIYQALHAHMSLRKAFMNANRWEEK